MKARYRKPTTLDSELGYSNTLLFATCHVNLVCQFLSFVILPHPQLTSGHWKLTRIHLYAAVRASLMVSVMDISPEGGGHISTIA